MRTIPYGSAPSQVGDLHLPATPHPRVVVLLHGGFWRMPYGREELAPLAADLAAHGFAVWNLEYRRVGEPGGGWPGSLEDAVAGIEHLARLAGDGLDLDLSHVCVVGHSAGGHLALQAASMLAHGARVCPSAAIGLAPVADLHAAHAARLGRDAVAALLGGTPLQHPDRYAAASPRARLPLRVRQLLLHGTRDTAVPLALTRDYAAAAQAAGDAVELIELPDADHFAFLDLASEAHARLCRWLDASWE